jgi:glycine betaine/proline transport system ATP-binding protein
MRLQSVVSKTIVFITHDFDEAIRVADRIAIMKDGAIVQAGTPEDIVLKPASAYVAEFTRHVPKAKVVRVQSIMKPTNSAVREPVVPARATVADAARLFVPGVDALLVASPEGIPLGTLDRASVVELIMRS